MHTDISKYKVLNKFPDDWKDLQVKTSQILSDIGFTCEVEKDIETVRGKVNVDVFGINESSQPKQVLIAECKYWSTNIPKSVVHSFRTVIGDSGANFGLIVSREGFQEGAIEAANNSNLLLFSWNEFLEYFKLQWLKSMIDANHKISLPLIHFTDSMGDFYDEEFDKLDSNKKDLFFDLKRQYSKFSIFGHKDYYLNYRNGDIEYLDQAIEERKERMPIEVNSYSDYFYFVRDYCLKGLYEFDNLFGKKLRK